MLHIRVATPLDAFELARVHVASWRSAYRGIIPDTVLNGLSEPARADAWRDHLSQTTDGTFLAELQGRMIGFADCGRSRDPDALAMVGELYSLYVHPDHWGTGVGVLLWAHTAEWLRQHSFSEVTLWVLEANIRARAFYERIGFTREAGFTKSAETAGTQLVHLRYRLSFA